MWGGLDMANKGLIIIYVGEGKGKTTAAMGVAFRALGKGLNVGVLQFVKGEWPSGEIELMEILNKKDTFNGRELGKLHLEVLGRGFVKILGDQKPFKVHKAAALDGVKKSKEMLKSGLYDVVVLDELLSAYEAKLIKLSDVEGVIKSKPGNVHLVITGHYLPARLKAKADLVTEMKMIKHPYYSGILAQRGIDY